MLQRVRQLHDCHAPIRTRRTDLSQGFMRTAYLQLFCVATADPKLVLVVTAEPPDHTTGAVGVTTYRGSTVERKISPSAPIVCL